MLYSERLLEACVLSWQEALKINPKNVDALSCRRAAKLALKDLRGAVADCTEALKPDLFDSYVIYA